MDENHLSLSQRIDSANQSLVNFIAGQTKFNDDTTKHFLDIDKYFQNNDQKILSIEKAIDVNNEKFQDYLRTVDVRKSELKDEINSLLTESFSQLDQKADDSIQSLRSEFNERLEGQSSIHSQQLSSLNKSVEENSMDVALCKDSLDGLRLQVDSAAHVGFLSTPLYPAEGARPNEA